MITLFSGEFYLVPEALDVSHNWCSHNCGYCFANLNKPNRRIETNKLFNQITNFHKQKNEVAFMLQNDMVVTVSNKTDPFAKTNSQIALPMLELFEDYKIKHSFQTRGGEGVEKYLKDISKSSKVFYISITHTDDKTRKIFETGAPTIESRWELAVELISLGHKVIIAYNPFWHEWIDINKEIERLKNMNGLSGVVIQKMHLNNIQYNNMSEYYKQIFEDIYYKTKTKKIINESKNTIIYNEFYNLLLQNKIKVKSYSHSNFDNLYSIYSEVYGAKSVFKTKDDFLEYCLLNKNDGDEIRFKEYYQFFTKDLPFKDREMNIAPYFRSIKTIDKNSTHNKKVKGYLRDVFEVFWNDWSYKRHPTMSRHFSILIETYKNKKYRLTDENNNLIYVFNKEKKEHIGTEYSNQRLNFKK